MVLGDQDPVGFPGLYDDSSLFGVDQDYRSFWQFSQVAWCLDNRVCEINEGLRLF